ncbi:MAG: rhomboid family intramembrane serine protease, partial [Gemmataceae bacterium]
MGIADRDYYREESNPGWRGWVTTHALAIVITVLVSVFVLQCLSRYDYGQIPDKFTENLALSAPAIQAGQIWRLVTSVLLHNPNNFWHIVSSLFLLYWMGREFEICYGSREFLALFLGGALCTGVVEFLLRSGGVIHATSASYGAQGVAAIFLAHRAVLSPDRTIHVCFVIPVPLWVVTAAIVGFSALGMLRQNEGSFSSCSVVLGALLGVLYAVSEVRLTANWDLAKSRPSSASTR